MQNFLNVLSACLSMQLHSWIVLQKLSVLEPANLQWSGQTTGLDYYLLMHRGITFLPILWSLRIHSYIILHQPICFIYLLQ